VRSIALALRSKSGKDRSGLRVNGQECHGSSCGQVVMRPLRKGHSFWLENPWFSTTSPFDFRGKGPSLGKGPCIDGIPNRWSLTGGPCSNAARPLSDPLLVIGNP
jgi:hypothetical protein